jgi:hypothetical protein
MRSAADAVTARALRHGLDPEQTIRSAAHDLVRMARGNGHTLEQGRARIERGIADRPSGVGLRARAMLTHALELVATGRARTALVEVATIERTRNVA